MISEKRKEYMRQWRLKNKERMHKYMMNYYYNNHERLKKYRRDWLFYTKSYGKKLDKIDERKLKRKIHLKKWKQSFNGRLSKKKDRNNRRYKQDKMLLDIIQLAYELNIKKYGKLTCCICFKSVKFGDDSIEHNIPISRANEFKSVNIHGIDNLDVAHITCNSSKGTKTLDEYRLWKNNPRKETHAIV